MLRAIVMVGIAAIAAAHPPLDGMGKAMLDPIREQALRPAELVTRLRLPPDAAVADVGAGPGFLTLPLARAVPRGTVLATDIRADYLEVAAERARAAGLHNVKMRVVPADRPALEPRSLDLILLCQVDHYLADRVSYFKALADALKPGGRIVLVNYARNREPAVTAVAKVGLRVIDEWMPSPAFFVIVVKR